MTEKPYKGELSDWFFVHFESGGKIAIGIHLKEDGTFSLRQTSLIISHNEETGMIETLNSLYRLVGGNSESRH